MPSNAGMTLTFFAASIGHTEVEIPPTAHLGLQHDFLFHIEDRDVRSIKCKPVLSRLVWEFVEDSRHDGGFRTLGAKVFLCKMIWRLKAKAALRLKARFFSSALFNLSTACLNLFSLFSSTRPRRRCALCAQRQCFVKQCDVYGYKKTQQRRKTERSKKGEGVQCS